MVAQTSKPVPIELEPSIYRDISPLQAGTKIVDGNFIRYRNGKTASINGWSKQFVTGSTFLSGSPRARLAWRDLTNVQWITYATPKQWFVEKQGTRYDITPLRDTNSLTDPFETTDGSSIVEITDVGSGSQPGQVINFAAPVTFNGITFDGPYVIISLISADVYTIDAGTNATSSGTGGGSVDIEYYITSGTEDTENSAGGYGAGGYGYEGYGDERAVGARVEARVWCLSNFGEDLLGVPTRGGALYFWDTSAGEAFRATVVSTAPDKNDFMLVTDTTRQCILFGTKDAEGDYDPLLIRGSDTEDYTDFEIAEGSNAFEFRLSKGSKIIGAFETVSGEILVWTDTSVYRMRPSTGTVIYELKKLNDKSGLTGPQAFAEAEGKVFWVSPAGIRMYDGAVRVYPTTFDRYYFDTKSENRIDFDQQVKIFGMANPLYNEIWFFVPTIDSGGNEISRYILINYQVGATYDGVLSRTCASLGENGNYPYMMNTAGETFIHETGNTGAGSVIPSFLQLGLSVIEEGRQYARIDHVIPDGTFEKTITMTLKGYRSVNGTPTVTKVKTFNDGTERVDVHLRGKYLSYRLDSLQLGGYFETGRFHIGLLPAGVTQ